MSVLRWMRRPWSKLHSARDGTTAGVLSAEESSPTSKPSFDKFSPPQYSTQAANYYDILEITPKASQRLIKASYYRLSKRYHPDVNQSSDAHLQFSKVAEAYEVLGNVQQRKFYDQGLLSGRQPDAAYSAQSPFTNNVYHRKGKPPSGRSHIYNFDEFYRQHYGDSRVKQHGAKVYWEEELSKRNEFRKRQYRMGLYYMMTLVSVMGAFLLRKKL